MESDLFRWYTSCRRHVINADDKHCHFKPAVWLIVDLNPVGAVGAFSLAAKRAWHRQQGLWNPMHRQSSEAVSYIHIP